MRHIPEEELHAYLDQALSRSQCVEIERHLARCARCQRERDVIAALRDRTTELLARLGPPPILPPVFASLQHRQADRRRRRRLLASGGWAASVAAALLLGWEVHSRITPVPATVPAQLPAAPRLSLGAPVRQTRLAFGAPATREASGDSVAPRRVIRMHQVPSTTLAARFAGMMDPDPPRRVPPTQVAEARSPAEDEGAPDLIAQPVRTDLAMPGLWRTILPDSAAPQATGDLPRVPGLPVVQMRVQAGNGDSDVTAVDQLLESGEVIRTIAGPAVRVGSLVEKQPSATQSAGDATYGRMTVTIRQGDQMVAVTGPSQALGSLLSRVDIRRRRY